MLNEQMISCFVEVVKQGSFSKAAEELYLSQQAVSKQVKHLEDEMGVELLSRTTRKVELTKAGSEYYEVFLKWQVDLEDVNRKVHRMTKEDMRLRIGMMSRMNAGKIPVAVHRLKAINGDYHLSIVQDVAPRLNEMLVSDEVDLLIEYDSFADQLQHKEKTKRVQVGATELLLCIAKNHPLAKEEVELEKHLNLLEKEAFLVCVDKGISKKEALDRSVSDRKAFGLGNGTVKLFPTIEEVNITTELGEGFCLCSSSSMFSKNPFIKTYRLPKTTKIMAVWKKDNPSKPLQELFHVLEELGPIGETISAFGE